MTVAATAQAMDADLERLERRRRIGVVNRRLGWALLPLVILAVGMHYAGAQSGTANDVVFALQIVYSPLALVHAAMSIYVYGAVPPAWTLRTFHIWFGYGYLGLLLASQTSFGVEPLHTGLTVAMFTCLAIHVGIGCIFAARRRQAGPSVRY